MNAELIKQKFLEAQANRCFKCVFPLKLKDSHWYRIIKNLKQGQFLICSHCSSGVRQFKIVPEKILSFSDLEKSKKGALN